MKSQILFSALLVAPLLTSLSCSGPSDSVSSPDAGVAAAVGHHPVVVVLMEGLRVDHLGSRGVSTSSTPALDAFALGAVRFDQAFAQAPEGAGSMASLLTGLYPTTHGLVKPGDHLVDEAVTLAEVLAAAGLKTAAFLASDAGMVGLGLEQGFDIFEVGPQALDGALEWIEQNAGSDFLLLVDAGAVEISDIDPDDAAVTYSAQLTAVDSSAGRVFGALDAAGLSDTATVAVVSLTGFALGEHGAIGEETIYAPVTHVPMFVRSPAISKAGAIDKIVEVLDLGPTILDLLGEEAPPELQGRSLLPLIEGAGTPPYVAFGESPAGGGQYYAALGGYRLIRSEAQDLSELYDLNTDPAERTDLAASEENRVAVLEDHLGAWQKMVSAASLDPDRRTAELDDEALEQLKSLGYIQ